MVAVALAIFVPFAARAYIPYFVPRPRVDACSLSVLISGGMTWQRVIAYNAMAFALQLPMGVLADERPKLVRGGFALGTGMAVSAAVSVAFGACGWGVLRQRALPPYCGQGDSRLARRSRRTHRPLHFDGRVGSACGADRHGALRSGRAASVCGVVGRSGGRERGTVAQGEARKRGRLACETSAGDGGLPGVSSLPFRFS